MRSKVGSSKSSTNLYSLSENLRNKLGIIILITITTIFLVNFIVSKINSYSSFKSKTILDGSRDISFDEITNLENKFNSFLATDSNLSSNKLQITNINYFDIYLKSLNKKLFIKLLDKNNFLNKKNYNSKTAYLNAISNIYENNLELKVEKRLIYQNQITNSIWSIRFTGPLEKKEKWVKILKELKKQSSKEFKNKVIESLKAKLILVNTVIDNDIELINNNINFYLKDHFDYKNKELLIYLNEQANIAKELGISNGLEYLKESEISEIFNLYDARGPEFLSFQWGFIAIQKKINDVLSREYKDAKYFVKEYQDLIKKKNEHIQSKIYYNTLYENSIMNLPFFKKETTEDLFAVSTEFSSNKINFTTTILLNILFIIVANMVFVAITLLKSKKT